MSTILKALRRLEEEKNAEGARPLGQQVAAAPASAPPRGTSPWLIAGGALALGLLVGGALFYGLSDRGEAPEVVAVAPAREARRPIERAPAPQPAPPKRRPTAAAAPAPAAKETLPAQAYASEVKVVERPEKLPLLVEEPLRPGSNAATASAEAPAEAAEAEDVAVLRAAAAAGAARRALNAATVTVGEPDSTAGDRPGSRRPWPPRPKAGPEPPPLDTPGARVAGGRTRAPDSAARPASKPDTPEISANKPPETAATQTPPTGKEPVAASPARTQPAAPRQATQRASQPVQVAEAPDVTPKREPSPPTSSSVPAASVPEPSVAVAPRSPEAVRDAQPEPAPTSNRETEPAPEVAPPRRSRQPAREPAAAPATEVAKSTPTPEPKPPEPEASAEPATEPPKQASRTPRKGTPAIAVERTRWHPRPGRRVAVLRLGDDEETVEVAEGESVGGLIVEEIKPSSVVFDDRGRSLTRSVGGKR